MALARSFRLQGDFPTNEINTVIAVNEGPRALGNTLRMTDMAGGQSRRLESALLTKSPTKTYGPIAQVRAPFKLR